VLSVAGLLFSTLVVQDAPATADTSQRPRLTALPVVSYSDVTGLQYGATGFLGFRDGSDANTRASSLSAYVSMTAKEHAKAYVQLDRWSARNSWRRRLRAEYISYPLPFFGIGPDSPESAEEWYSSGVTTLQAFSQNRMKGSTYLHIGARLVRSHLREFEAGGIIAADSIHGSSGSRVAIAEFGLVVDSRDNVAAPRNGTFARVIPSIAVESRPGSTVQRLTIDARRYYPVGDANVAAIQLQYDAIAGTTPFDLMPMIGADTAMRGYARGRYRDQHAFTAQGEFRAGYWRRIGLVGFAGAGTVAQEFSRIAGSTWYPSVGAGLRYLLVPKDRTVARLDLGIGRSSFGISVGIGEAF
jgi:outer membrane protein assembly factor BamA